MSRVGEHKPGAQATVPPRRRTPETPPAIPDHELVRLIGRGSYGEVWLGRTTVGAWRAVKIVYRDHFDNARPYEREFLGIQKYEPISRTNEGLVDVLQIGRNDAAGYFYYVMELADDASRNHLEAGGSESSWPAGAARPGTVLARQQRFSASRYTPRTLALDLLRRAKLPLAECVALGLKLNLALGHLHRNGLIHRDVKPPNVIFVNGVPKLADIGLVTDMAGANSFVGTEGYVAPEGPNSVQADLYALGKLLYEAALGRDRHEFPKGFTGLRNGPDEEGWAELEAVLLRACAPDPRSRYESAAEMNEDLALLHSGKSVRQKHALERRLKLTTRVAVAAVALMVLGVFPYYWAITGERAARLASREARASEQKAAEAQAGEARARAMAEQRLYDSLLGEARATRMARRVGYRERVFELLEQARGLNVANKNLADLRREAGQCLGDFVGLPPVTFSDFPANTLIRRAVMDLAGQTAAFVLNNGSVRLRRLPEGGEVAHFQLPVDLPTRSVCFNHAGDQLVFVHMPDRKRLETALPDATVAIHTREADGQWRETWSQPLPGALDCLSTPEGNYVTVYSEKPRSGKLVEVPGGKVLLEFEIPQNWIPEVALSPDGRWLVVETAEPVERSSLETAGGLEREDAVLEVWDLKAGRRSARLRPRRGILRSLGFSLEGEFLMCAARSSGGVIYEVGSFRTVAEFSAYAREPLVFAPGGQLVALPSSQDNRIRLWDWSRNQEFAMLDEPKPAHKIAFAPDGSFLLTVSLEHARLYRLEALPEKLNLKSHAGHMPGVAFGPGGTGSLRVATVGLNPDIRVSDAATGCEIWKSDSPQVYCLAPAFSPDGQWLAAGDVMGKQVILWDAQTGERLLEIPTRAGGRLWSVQISPDGRHLVTASSISASGEHGVELWAIHRTAAGEPGGTLEARCVGRAGASAWSPTFSPDGRWVAYADRDLRGVYVWDFQTSAPPRCVATNLIHGVGSDQSLAFTPDSRRLLMVDRHRKVVTLDVTTGEPVASFPTIDARRTPEWTHLAGISLSPDGRKLAMISASGRGTDVWSPATGRLEYSIPEQDATIHWQAWDASSQRLALALANGQIAIWNLREFEHTIARLGLNP